MAFNLVKVIGDVFSNSKTEVEVTSKDNPGITSSNYQTRGKNVGTFYFPQAWVPHGSGIKKFRNVFDQTITVVSTYDQPVIVRLWVLELGQGESEATGQKFLEIDLGTIPAGDSNPSMLTIAPEVTDSPILHGRAVSVPELRQPYPAFAVRVFTADGDITSGEVKFLNVRRY